MQAAMDLGHQFLFRACKDRAIARGATAEGPQRHLKSFARSLPSQAHGEVIIPSQGGRPARTAQVQMAARQVWFLVPQLERSVHPDWAPIAVWVERVWEPNPPADVEEPLEWILLSSLPAADAEQLHQRCDWYACRPLIEDFHQVEKTGCGEEDLRFETAEAMLPMLGVLAIVAVRVLQLRWWGRDGRDGAGGVGVDRRGTAGPQGLGSSRADGAGLRPGGRRTGRVPGPQGRRRTRLADAVARLSAAPGHRPGPANQSRSRHCDFRECHSMSIAPS